MSQESFASPPIQSISPTLFHNPSPTLFHGTFIDSLSLSLALSLSLFHHAPSQYSFATLLSVLHYHITITPPIKDGKHIQTMQLRSPNQAGVTCLFGTKAEVQKSISLAMPISGSVLRVPSLPFEPKTSWAQQGNFLCFLQHSCNVTTTGIHSSHFLPWYTCDLI